MLQPIPTLYRGAQFRSRAEARWAVLFDGIGLEWEYEKEGFQLPTQWYLPDFWSGQLSAFGEVKAATEQWDEAALLKARELAAESRRAVLLLSDVSCMEPLVPALCPCGVEIDQHNVDLRQSLERGRIWVDDDLTADLMEWWASPAERARHYRFYR